MTKQEMRKLVRSMGASENTVTAMENAYEMGVEFEREACAKVCESGADAMHPTVEGHVMKNFGASTHLAQAIRNRGEA